MNKFMILIKKLIIVTILFIFCSDSNVSGPGGSTETIGVVYYDNGEKAPNTKVVFIPSDFDPQVDTLKSNIDSTSTDENGRYNLPNHLNGLFNILYEKDSLKAVRNSVAFINGKVDSVINDTLKQTSTVNGVVKLLPGHDCRNVFILLIGSDRYTIPFDSIGNFTLQHLAPGEYNLKLLTSYNNYNVKDTTIRVNDGIDTIKLDTIQIPYIGIETPENLNVEYDSLLMEAKISWHRVHSENIAGYNIYKKIVEIDSCYKIQNNGVITDTFFVDSSSYYEGTNCLYKIASVDKNGGTGSFGDSLIVNFSTCFKIVKSKQIANDTDYYCAGITASNNNIYIISKDNSHLFKIDSSGHKIDTINLQREIKPLDINIMDDRTILVASESGIFNIDSLGNILYQYHIKSRAITSYQSRYIYYTTNSEFFTTINTIRVLDTYTGDDSLFHKDDDKTITSINIKDNKIFILKTFFNEIEFEYINLDSGTLHQIFRKNNKKNNTDIAISENYISVLFENEILNFSTENYKKLSKTKLISDMIYVCRFSDRTIVAMDNNGSLVWINNINSN